MRKVIVALIGIALISTFAIGCSKSEKAAPAARAASGQKRMFFSSAWYTTPYGAPMQEAALTRAAELGYSIQIVDGEGNSEKQLSQFRTAFADGYDGFIYWPGDTESTPPVVEYLLSTGKPWVVVNTVVDDSVRDKVLCTIASDEVEIGRWVGRLILEFFDKNPALAKNISYIEGAPGSSYTNNVTLGVNEIIAGKGINILNERMYSDFDPTKAMTIMEDILTRFGNRVVLSVSQDGGIFHGAYSAVEASGYLGRVNFLCQGQDLIVREKLESGELYASVAQDPFDEGSLSVIMLDKLIKGEPVDKWVKVPTGPIYVGDVAKYSWF